MVFSPLNSTTPVLECLLLRVRTTVPHYPYQWLVRRTRSAFFTSMNTSVTSGDRGLPIGRPSGRAVNGDARVGQLAKNAEEKNKVS